MAVSQLGYLGIGVSNLDQWEGYVREVLGMEVIERAEDGTSYVRMDELHHRIALYPNGKDDIVHVGWQTANRKSFEATKESLLVLAWSTSRGPLRRPPTGMWWTW